MTQACAEATADEALAEQLRETRELSLRLAAPLSAEDMVVQAMDDASPTKWHLAHTSWFFEAFLLTKLLEAYEVFDEAFSFCFNSYYEQVGARQPRQKRGLLTRPSLQRVLDYRRHVDLALNELMRRNDSDPDVRRLIELGINHEQQHQELMLTDILALFAANPLRPAYREEAPRESGAPPLALHWLEFRGGLADVGHDGFAFCFDNETPRHRRLIYPFQLAHRLVANAEWLEFIADGGYETATLWLSDGWDRVTREGWRAPLYWEEHDGRWLAMSLQGLQPLEGAAPVAHVSYFEADAFARWAGARLPTEFEWEIAAASASREANDLGRGALRPLPAPASRGGLAQMFGDVWEWTTSAYSPYPGFRAAPGALGEYNGKFMANQQTLRGGSCVTPRGHTRATYRNFFYPHQRWQFMGLRLAKDAG